MMIPPASRRTFIRTGFLALSTVALNSCRTPARRFAANEKLNLGVVGVANRGGANLSGVRSQNIVALCDVDADKLNAAAQFFPATKRYSDWRRLLDQRDLDGVVVSTPDHTHAVVTVAALRSGRHVYCEKPLTHTVSELRVVAATTRQTGLVTQMGNQIHSGENYRRVVEIVRSGTIGEVRECHHWIDGGYQPMPLPPAEPVPAGLDYELWLGPVQPRHYSKEWVPFNWRRWWHFGGGTLSDFCCHHMDLGVWALDLGLPLTVEAEGPPVDAHCAPPWLIVRYTFAGRGNLPPVALTWYNGGKRPPQFAQGLLTNWGAGSLFVGSKGMLLADYDKYRLFPEKDFAGYQPPAPTIPRVPGHHEEWIEACKRGTPTTSCNFGYGAKLAEIGLLGNVAYRSGCKLEWDAKRMKAVNCAAADRFIHHDYRPGWKL